MVCVLYQVKVMVGSVWYRYRILNYVTLPFELTILSAMEVLLETVEMNSWQ